MLLVIPHLRVLVQRALVDLVEIGEGSWLVVFLLLLGLALLLWLADQQDLFLLVFGRGLLLVVGTRLDVEIIGVIEVFG